MQVIYHCDDLGLSPEVTARILAAWEAGLLDGFSLLANGSATPAAAARLRASPERPARLAVHLNLYEGPALSEVSDVPNLVDRAGRLNASFGGLLGRWMLGNANRRKQLLAQVEREWRRQIETVRQLVAPRAVAALDGHVHLHMLPFLFPIAVSLAEEFRIPAIRITDEPFHVSARLADQASADFLVNLVKHLVLRACVPAARRRVGHSAVSAPDAFLGVLYTGRMTTSAARAGLERAARRGARTVELLFHPGEGEFAALRELRD